MSINFSNSQFPSMYQSLIDAICFIWIESAALGEGTQRQRKTIKTFGKSKNKKKRKNTTTFIFFRASREDDVELFLTTSEQILLFLCFYVSFNFQFVMNI